MPLPGTVNSRDDFARARRRHDVVQKVDKIIHVNVALVWNYSKL
jgi:hypothetical protein